MPSPARHIVNTVGRKDVGGDHLTAGKNVDSRRFVSRSWIQPPHRGQGCTFGPRAPRRL
jgi:hypothetical protein